MLRIIAVFQIIFILGLLAGCVTTGTYPQRIKPLKFYDGIQHRQDGNPNG